jgi:hypothetical protein
MNEKKMRFFNTEEEEEEEEEERIMGKMIEAELIESML